MVYVVDGNNTIICTIFAKIHFLENHENKGAVPLKLSGNGLYTALCFK